MNTKPIAVTVSVLFLSACGGEEVSMAVGAGGPPGGTPPPGSTIGTLQPIFTVGLPTAQQLESVFSFERSVVNDFDVANRSAFIVPAGAIANFDGEMQVNVNGAEEYLSGDLNLQFNLIQGTANGTIDSMSISGADTNNRLLSVFDVLDVTIPNVNGSDFTGTITGTFVDQAASGSGFNDFAVDTAVDGSFVEGFLSDNIVGVVDGSITDTALGTSVPVFGVVAGERDLFDNPAQSN